MSYLADLLTEHRGENFFLHEHYLNAQMVKVLKTIGYDRLYTRAIGPYLYDEKGDEYLDLLAGWGVFALGRNHPKVKAALQDVLAQDLPDMVQLDVSLLAGLLAERMLRFTPGDICKLFFCDSGAEAVEAAIKFTRYTTKRAKILYLEHGFHGLTSGALSLNGERLFQGGSVRCFPNVIRFPSTTSRRWTRRCAAGTWRLSSSSRFRARASTSRPTTICPRRRACVASTARCSWPMRSRPASVAPANSSPWSTGA